MSRTGKRRSDGKAAWELRKLQAETEIAERQLAEMPMRRLFDIVKVSVAIVGVIIAMIVMFQTIGLLSLAEKTMWETKETLEGGLRIDRMWWAAVKVGAIVAVSVLIAIAIAFAFL